MPSKCCKNPADNSEFLTYVRIINALITTLRRPKDRECAQDILAHCMQLNGHGKSDVINYTNAFLGYFIKVLHTTAATQPLEVYDGWFKNLVPNTNISAESTHMWRDDNKSYFALEKTPTGCVVFYSAIAIDPEAGWDDCGLKEALRKYQDDSSQVDN